MRQMISTSARLAMLGALFAFGSAAGVSTPAAAYPAHPGCYLTSFPGTFACPGSRHDSGSSTGQYADRCNGEPGFWYAVTFANGETLCIARSPADFYHNGDQTPTCTIKSFDEENPTSTTTDGACPPPYSQPPG